MYYKNRSEKSLLQRTLGFFWGFVTYFVILHYNRYIKGLGMVGGVFASDFVTRVCCGDVFKTLARPTRVLKKVVVL